MTAEYIPYGEEWKKEISKLKKEQIIEMFSAKANELTAQKEDYHTRATNVVAKNFELTARINKLELALRECIDGSKGDLVVMMDMEVQIRNKDALIEGYRRQEKKREADIQERSRQLEENLEKLKKLVATLPSEFQQIYLDTIELVTETVKLTKNEPKDSKTVPGET